MTSEDKLHPELSEAGSKEAFRVLENFKISVEIAIKEVAEKCLSNFYSDILPHIESDTWINYRGSIISAIQDYETFKKHNSYDAKRIREAIYEKHREELIEDLNQDLLKEVDSLKEAINILR